MTKSNEVASEETHPMLTLGEPASLLGQLICAYAEVTVFDEVK
ncbi:hypothetical protein [Marinicella litoralis]|nr:hypothetical protein [Marinicella litoralis]